MKTSLLMFGLLLLGIGTAIVAVYVDGILEDKKCNSNMIDIYIKTLLALSTACIVFSASYFICILRCGDNISVIDVDGRLYLFVMALLCITICVITSLLHNELNNNSCNFNNIYTIVLISITSVLFIICIGLVIASFYYFRYVSLEDIRQINKKRLTNVNLEQSALEAETRRQRMTQIEQAKQKAATDAANRVKESEAVTSEIAYRGPFGHQGMKQYPGLEYGKTQQGDPQQQGQMDEFMRIARELKQQQQQLLQVQTTDQSRVKQSPILDSTQPVQSTIAKVPVASARKLETRRAISKDASKIATAKRLKNRK